MRPVNLAAFIAIAFAVFQGATPALAGCLEKCAASCSAYAGNTTTRDCTARCVNSCDETPADHGDKKIFGAVAFSPSTYVSGSSDDGFSQQNADEKAIADCKDDDGKTPADCKVAERFSSACAAVALQYGTDHNSYGIGTSTSLRNAEIKALKTCGQRQCVVNYSFCTK